MKIRTAQLLTKILLTLGFLIAILGAWLQPFFIMGVIVMFSCLIPDLLFNKCPHCGKYLGRNYADFCQFCGKPIDE